MSTTHAAAKSMIVEKSGISFRSYRLHGNVARVFREVGIVILEPLRIVSHLFGHLDGMNESDTLCEVAPELPTEDQAFVRGIGRLVEQLRDLWDTRGEWPSYDAWIDVGAVWFQLFEEFGVHTQPRLDGQVLSMSLSQWIRCRQDLRRPICCAP
ncbi:MULTISPECIES: hypothetical protein [Rhizobium]|uniref:hypothetical protein n=1 Tax=Rhizobium TaxID=379 RepID=UPI001FD9BBAF|nr:hypothetical protein [Rhizobium lusitanum]